jgi:hypothetical protein
MGRAAPAAGGAGRGGATGLDTPTKGRNVCLPAALPVVGRSLSRPVPRHVGEGANRAPFGAQ